MCVSAVAFLATELIKKFSATESTKVFGIQASGPGVSNVPFDCLPVCQIIEKLAVTVLSQHTLPTTRKCSHECLSILAGGYNKQVSDLINLYASSPSTSMKSVLDEWKTAVWKLRNIRVVVQFSFML